jgi:putative ABC transport system permease protein
MIRHVLTLMWNRRWANALLILEIFLAYVVLFAVGTICTSLWENYRQPLGFGYDNVWEVNFSSGTQSMAERYITFEQVLARLRATQGVVAVAPTGSNTPFSFNDSRTSLEISTEAGEPERPINDINFYFVGPELREVVGLKLTAGRWFDQRDVAQGTHPPMVINEQLQRALYPNGESAVGKILPLNGEEKQRIIGVISDYRTDGELSEVHHAMFSPLMPADTATHEVRTLLVRVAPGSGAALEKRISDDIRRIGPGWTSTIRTLDERHSSQLKQVITRPLLLVVMSVFLLINVALGLFGVLWLAISARRAELGVRRALGASAGAISRLIVGETLALTTFGLVLGLLVAVQFPLLGAFAVPAGVYITAMGLAAVGLYILALVCALYPSQLAASIQPAVALREE